ncbi:hypothetical protein VMCG_04420 [Cytospora schulzeri]|uniref:Uncharacterized protein n=1 Tax=Cytospora schulzeri TaxID=448051 RepID=A0A423WSY8_9PEZI|nr:hypothetical protein VMCG_04420 [Valsa malicola]
MDPSRPPHQSRKKYAASGPATSDSANEMMHHDIVGDASRGRDSHTRVPAAEKKGQEHLSAWNHPRMAQRLLLDIQYECARNNLDIRWDRIAHRMSPGSSSGDLHHYLRRMRQQLIAEGHVIPPQVGLGGCRAANNGLDARGFVRNVEDRADLTTTGPVGWNDFHHCRHSLADAINAPVSETTKDETATKTELSEDDCSHKVDAGTTVALQSRCGVGNKNFCALADSGEDEDEDEVKVEVENPFDDCYECKEEAAQDDGDAVVNEMESTDCDRTQLGDTVSQGGSFAANNAAAATVHPRAWQTNSHPYGSFYGQAQPWLTSIDDPMLVSYDGGLSFNPAPARSITEWSSSYTVYSGAAAAAQVAAELGYGPTVQSLFSQAVNNPSAFGAVTQSPAPRSENNRTRSQNGTPTPTRNTQSGAAKKSSATLPTTPTSKRKQSSDTYRSVSSFEHDDATDITPRASASSSSRGISGNATTSSVKSSRPSSSETVISAAIRGNLNRRWNDDGGLSNAFADIGLGGPGKSNPAPEDEDAS